MPQPDPRPLVAIDGRFLQRATYGERGIGRVARALALGLPGAAPHLRFALVGADGVPFDLRAPPPPGLALETYPRSLLATRAPRVKLELLFEEPAFRRTLRRIGARAVIVPSPHAAFPGGSGVPRLLVLLDAIPYLFSEEQSSIFLKTFNALMLRGARAARAVVAISRATARDAERVLGIDPRRITVAHLGCDAPAPPAPEAVRAARAARGLPGRYLLHVGGFDARKNVAGLLRAFARLAPEHPGLVLALGGRVEPRQKAALEAAIAAIGPDAAARVRVLGFVPDPELPALLAGAAALAFASRYEGFGLPLLEALALGVPAVAFDNSAIPEVAGDAALLVRDGDEAALAEALGRLLRDDALRAELARRGPEQARGFRWETFVRATAGVAAALVAPTATAAAAAPAAAAPIVHGGPRPPPRRSESGGDPPRCAATGARPGTALRAEQFRPPPARARADPRGRRMIRYGLALICESPEPAGASTYAVELARALAPLLAPDERLVVIRHHRFPRPVEHPRVEDVRVPIPAGRSVVRRFFEQLILPGAGLALRLDLIHGPNHVLPLLWPGRTVLTVLDARLYDARSGADAGRRIFREHVYPWSCRRADAVLAISNATADAVAAAYGVPRGRFEVVPLGVDRRFSAAEAAAADALLAATPARGRPYVLHVGQQLRHKNLPRLVDAYAAALRDDRLAANGACAPALVLAGSPGEDTPAIEERVRRAGLAADVVRLGYVPAAALPGLYRGARALAYPSLLEGFGLPPLEAMAAGIPVLAGDIPALREVAGDAALFVPPEDDRALAQGLARICAEGAERDRLVALGRARVELYRWSRTAERTLAVYRRVAKLTGLPPFGRRRPAAAPVDARPAPGPSARRGP